MKKSYAVILAPLLLSGCMMLGMGGMGLSGGGGMHGASPGSAVKGQTIIKESIANGIRITAEFPPYALGDELVYPVTLHSVRDNSIVAIASIALTVTLDDTRNQGSHSGHLDSSMTQNNLGKITISPDNMGNGTYVFRPLITTAGSYTFVFFLGGVGNVTTDPPIEVRQTVQLDSLKNQHSGNGGHGSGIAPTVLIGASIMAIMMLFMFR